MIQPKQVYISFSFGCMGIAWMYMYKEYVCAYQITEPPNMFTKPKTELDNEINLRK